MIGLILTSFLLTGISSCEEKVDAFRCVLVQYDDNKNLMPIDEWYWFCKNPKTKEIDRIDIMSTGVCIRDKSKLCKWTATDVTEYDKGMKFYERQCKK